MVAMLTIPIIIIIIFLVNKKDITKPQASKDGGRDGWMELKIKVQIGTKNGFTV